jgi:hypothetical protein
VRHYATPDEAFAESGRGRYEVIARERSPDGRRVAALLRLRETGYLLDAVYVHEKEGWTDHSVSSGGGQTWTWLPSDDARNVGVLRIAHQAPAGAAVAIVRWKDREYEVPVANGWLYFVRWDVDESDIPRGDERQFRIVTFQ